LWLMIWSNGDSFLNISLKRMLTVNIFHLHDEARLTIPIPDLPSPLGNSRRVLSPNNRDWWSHSLCFNDWSFCFLYQQAVASFINEKDFIRRLSRKRMHSINRDWTCFEIGTNWNESV
jgi:hypothetical protein